MRTLMKTDRCSLLHGDAGEMGSIVGENTVDAICTDPPAGIGFMNKSWDKDRGGRDQWIAWLAKTLAPSFSALKPGGHALVWALPRTSHWTALALEYVGFEIRDVHHHIFGTGFPKSLNIGKALTQAASPEAQGMEGFGTALKPAVEHWILARKPLCGTYANNVIMHGTGALNIVGCRIGEGTSRWRWPAHVSLEHAETCAPGACVIGCPVRLLDEQSGVLKSGARAAGVRKGHQDGSGGASRFFYVAKPPRRERDAGLAHLPAKGGGEATGRLEGAPGTANPRAGAGRTGGARNFHPTVKSIELMRWLIRLITPPGGVVLDPFAGSGTTGVAALAEGCRFVGVEQADEYIPILEGRLGHQLGAA